eukprot:g23996.t1
MGSTSGGKVYVWGCNSDGRLGLGHDRNELVPVLVESVQNTKMSLVAAGEVHSGAVDVKGSLYMWGLGAYGRLGLGEAPVSQLALGIFHSVALAGNRIQSVYTWGYGEALGNQVGGGISLSPRVVSFGDDTKTQVLQIAAGPYHTLVLMENGELMTFGSGASGRLGTGNSKNHKLPVSLGSHGFATKLKQSWEIARLECGDMFTCAVTWHGALYTWGCGARGQLGTGSLQETETGRRMKSSGKTVPLSWVPKVVRMPSGRLVKSIGCGRDHCIAVTYDGNAYAWGKGDKGQLGVGRNEDTATPKAVHIHNVLSCAAGEDHSGAICRGEEDNELWMWGATELGKLGLGEAQLTSADSVPVAIRSLAKSENSYKVPISLSCGQYHTAVICAREKDDESDRVAGRVWTFGAGWFGRLGHNNMDAWTKLQVAYHTCALSYERGMMNDNGELTGDLWVWGRNRCICEHEHAKVPTKFMQIDGQPKVTCVATSDMTTMLESPQPEIIRNLPQPPILMSAGPAHMVVYARNKAMMAWGNQSCGRLGLQEKRMEKVIFKPCLVRAEWGSIEAMSGADQDEEEASEAQKVTAAALATIGEAAGEDVADEEGFSSDGQVDQDSEEEDKTKENMLHAITSGLKVQRFSTMQQLALVWKLCYFPDECAFH